MTAVTWTYVATVESETRPGVRYEIKRAPCGALGCSCPAYRFVKGRKSCKHIAALLGVEAMETTTDRSPDVPARPAAAKVTTHQGETFLVTRRAIVLGGTLM